MHAFALICGGYFACEVEIGLSQKTLSIGAVVGNNVHGKVRVVPGKSGQTIVECGRVQEPDTCVFVEEKADIEGPERTSR